MTKKAATFHKVWHRYMIIHAITDEMIPRKLVDLSFMNTTSSIACKNTIYNMRYAFYTKRVHMSTKLSCKNHVF